VRLCVCVCVYVRTTTWWRRVGLGRVMTALQAGDSVGIMESWTNVIFVLEKKKKEDFFWSRGLAGCELKFNGGNVTRGITLGCE